MFKLHSSGLLYQDQLGTAYIGHSTKKAGDARNKAVITNLLRTASVTYNSIIIPKQTHSTNIAVIEDASDGIQYIDDCDGLITPLSGVVLSVVTADCVPVVYVDPVQHMVGVSHGGWKGSLANMAAQMVDCMEISGAKAEDIHCYIGSAIDSCCYNIPEDRTTLFTEAFPDYASSILEQRDNQTYLSLQQLNMLQLEEAGVLREHIYSLNMCTQSNPDLFFSYRRDSKEQFGEMLTFVVQ